MSGIKTYQDLVALGENDRQRMDFVLAAIRAHKESKEYKIAEDAALYYKHQNPTIMRYQKYVYNRFGQAVPDIWSANNKIASNWYFYFITQGVQYLLGNGVNFDKGDTKEKLGEDFDRRVQDAAEKAKNSSASFGFWNFDHLEVFDLLEFAPLFDEENGGLAAGIRFWQIDDQKPLRVTLYELDGYTDYIKRKDSDMEILHPKRAYKQIVRSSEIDGETIIDGENYPTFPIVPLWNINRQSDLAGNQGTLDAYDLMASKLINNVSEGNFLYWVLKNCGGMDATDDAKFVEQLMITHVAHADGDDGAEIDSKQVEVPFQASESALAMLKEQLYHDFMGLKVEEIASGSVTATQIKAAYEPINQKTDKFEQLVSEFVEGILQIAGIDDKPTYTRSQMSNQAEIVDIVMTAAEYLSTDYITEKILTLLGDVDKLEKVLKERLEEESKRVENTPVIDNEADEPEPEETEPPEEE